MLLTTLRSLVFGPRFRPPLPSGPRRGHPSRRRPVCRLALEPLEARNLLDGGFANVLVNDPSADHPVTAVVNGTTFVFPRDTQSETTLALGAGGRVVVAFNALYGPEVVRSRETGITSHESTLGFSSALMAQVLPGVFVGGEARYLRRYEGLGLDTFAGHAVFIGPTIYANLSERSWIAVGWSAQVAGRAADDPAWLDLTNFERHQARLLFGFTF